MGRILTMVFLLLVSSGGLAATGQPFDDGAALDTFDTAHPMTQRPHERRPVLVVDWDSARRFAVNVAADVLCDLGVLALALPACLEFAELDEAQPTDWQQILRRPVEQRMQSI